MIPDVLISKYLDGELSLEEDVEFRAMLAADPEAREAFDAAVLLHIAMRCEDDTAVPSDVEHRVLSFIDSVPAYAHHVQSAPVFDFATLDAFSEPFQAPSSQRVTSVKGHKTRGLRARRVWAVAAMLLVMVLPFGDQLVQSIQGVGQVGTPDAALLLEAQKTGLVQPRRAGTTASSTVEVVQQDQRIVDILEPTSTNSIPVVAEMAVPAEATVSLDLAAQQPLRGTGNGVVAPTVHSLFVSPNVPVSSIKSVPPPRPAPILLAEGPNVDVLVTTSFSQSVTAPTEGAVTSVSAGIGYGIDGSTFVGMEMGSTRYTRTGELYGLAESNQGPTAIADVPQTRSARNEHRNFLSKVTQESNFAPQHPTEVRTVLSSEGTFWGAAFLQSSLIKTGILSLNGRLGAGVGEDGMLTYGRMQAECSVFSGVSVTVGAEARYSPFRTGAAAGQPQARSYGTVISALYGLQVRL